ncbi:putative extra-cytoplasmic solute receptor [Cupriavidus taiwanensis]|uniref:Extra-cytoplasmic solute receptor n=1 Tax=Cupriavidus taiwanensis TaxID=164546 RepID=A0A375E0G6_9BURK|nr:tripartite tricarboxylate transporter substrate binding protein [Cupriavidus taiwanensis]SOZ55142.1 putative extra-cytoplasmic solute receptor [Cupriavidus taiwanensis]SOZ56032.1 putative extra-cytoplasmic solute receptor [Cupriavidus taiwanensis]SOZ58831.1 putative extra-cytoplasmic solute receptor [Cupriavidus taiwanensis]SPA05322.1 putative extra-cytoplasmic solute receptor [Cupriavidus taiwanensis]SPA17492.1 putative extra-cytoplasmic solute receptor [Cupriavidus taiwanensis]
MDANPGRRLLLKSLLALPAAAALGRAVAASPYPSRPIRLVVPYAAGGGPDIQTRKLAERLAHALGQPVVVENKVGAGGILAAEFVAQQPADGYTLMLGASTHVAQKLLQPGAKFDPMAFTHIIRVGVSPSVLVVGAGSPYRNVADLAAAARRAPGTLNYASGGIGSAAHVSGAAFASATGIDVVHVPYKGSVEIVPSLLKGDTQFGFPVAATAIPQLASGKVRALAVTSASRAAALPQVPTLNEALGRKDLDLDAWSGIWAPPRLPAAITARLHAAVMQALEDPGLRRTYADMGAVLAPTPAPEAFSRLVADETARLRQIIDKNRITTE